MLFQARLLGRISFCCDGADMPGLAPRKVQELLCYILLHQQRPIQREMLASILWPNTPTNQSRANLRKTLWQLQAAFSASAIDSPVAIEPGWIAVNPANAYWCDVTELEQRYAQVCGIAGATMSDECAQHAEQAVAIYHGDLLEGWYQDWCLSERERIQHIYLSLLDKLMAYYEHHQQYEPALAHGATILRYDCARELTHRHLMRLHMLAGDRTGALRQFERCAYTLREELNAEPSVPTIQLYQQILANAPIEAHTDDPQLPLSQHLALQALPLPSGEAALDGTLQQTQQRIAVLLNKLCKLEQETAILWQEVRESIRAIEQLLRMSK